MPAAAQRARPLVEHRRGAAIAAVDRRIAVARDDEVAVQHAAVDRAARFERGREPVVPAERFGRGRQRQDLHVGGRHHQLAGIQPIQALARSSDSTSTAHTPRSMIGASKTRAEVGSQLARPRRGAARRCAPCTGCCATRSPRRREDAREQQRCGSAGAARSYLIVLERFDDAVDDGGVDDCGARAAPRAPRRPSCRCART